jgi:hypothetical protein
VLALLLAACGAPPAGTRFEATVAAPDGSYAMPVILGDSTGLVRSIAAAPGEPGEGFDRLSITTDPQDANALLVAWPSGACEDNTTMSFVRLNEGFGLYAYVNGGIAFGGCPAILLFRRIRIVLSEPVAPQAIQTYLQD